MITASRSRTILNAFVALIVSVGVGAGLTYAVDAVSRGLFV